MHADVKTSPVDAMFQTSWLRKFSSALIPRGMELMDSHTISLDSQFSNLILKKIAAEMKNDEYFKREDIMDGESFLDLFQTYADTLQGRSMEGTLVHPECFRYDDKRIALSESQ